MPNHPTGWLADFKSHTEIALSQWDKHKNVRLLPDHPTSWLVVWLECVLLVWLLFMFDVDIFLLMGFDIVMIEMCAVWSDDNGIWIIIIFNWYI